MRDNSGDNSGDNKGNNLGEDFDDNCEDNCLKKIVDNDQDSRNIQNIRPNVYLFFQLGDGFQSSSDLQCCSAIDYQRKAYQTLYIPEQNSKSY